MSAICSKCGSTLRTGLLAGQCTRCMLSLARDSGTDAGGGIPGLFVGGGMDELLDPGQVRQVGDYRLLKELARGGMGVVYRAHQVSLNRPVALKMILTGQLASPESVQRFRLEAEAAARLQHPNIVPIYEVGEHETQHFFTMKLVEGGSLADRKADFGLAAPGLNGGGSRASFRERERAAARLVATIAGALDFAHQRGVLHRDLKPTNILMDEDGSPQLTDFGLAKLTARASGLTISTAVLGSPSYMAPEQAAGKSRDVSTAVDIYGLGAVLYELLTGRPPFEGDSAMETMRKVIDEEPVPVARRNPLVHRDLTTICHKCLEKEPAARYLSAREVADELERFLRDEPISARPVGPAERTWRWMQRRPRIAALLVLLAFSFLSGLGGVIWQWRKAEHARASQSRSLAHLEWREIGRWLNEGEIPRALAYLASVIRERPDRWQAAMYAMSIVDQHSLPVLAGPEISPPVKLVGSAVLSPDGDWLAAAGEDRVVRVWDVVSGKETAQYSLATPVTALAAGGGAGKLAVATQDGALAIWTERGSAAVNLMRGDATPVGGLRFSGVGSRLLARSKVRVELWPTSAPGSVPQAVTLGAEIKGAEPDASGTRVLIWGAKEAVVWDAGPGRELLRMRARQQFGQGAMAADGRRVVLLDGAGNARCWQTDSGQELRPVGSENDRFNLLALDATGNRLTVAGGGNLISVYDVDSGLPVSAGMAHHYFVQSVQASPEGTRTITQGWDDAVNVWDARTGLRVMGAIVFGGARGRVQTAASADGRRILVHLPADGGTRDSLKVWRGSTLSEPMVHAVPGQRGFNTSSLSPDGRLGALGLSPDNRCRVYELATGNVLLDQRTDGPVYVQLFSPDRRHTYTLTANGWLYGWDLATGNPLWKPNRQPGMIRPAALSPDGTRIIAGHNDGHIRVYDTATGELVRTLDHPGEVKVLRFAPDRSGRFLSASTDRLAHLWDLQTGRKEQTFAGHDHTIIAGAWSPDSRWVATASYDTTARVWDAGTGQPVGEIMPHFAWLSHLEFSPDGTRLATGCRDGTVRLWEPRTGRPASSVFRQGRTVETVRFSADGSVFLVRDHDGFGFWETATAEPVTQQYRTLSRGGLGMDSESYRALMTPDGTGVFLGASMNRAEFWTVPQPRGRAPAWFPDFLEALAQMRLGRQGEFRLLPLGRLDDLVSRIQQTDPADPFAVWAKKILAIGDR